MKVKKRIDILKYRKIASDFSYSVISSLIYTGIIQIFVYPLLAKMLGMEEYGILLTSMGIINTISMALGNTLNNTRLILDKEYKEKKLVGDFNVILIFASIGGFIISIIFSVLYLRVPQNFVILFAVLSTVNILKSYFTVYYRVQLVFRDNLIVNIISVSGYIIGIALISVIKYWPLIFILGELLGLIYCIVKSNMLSEGFKLTGHFKFTFHKYLILTISGTFASSIMYLDRLMIYPILGYESVTVYSVASFFGKSLGIVMIPIASVLLGYYSQRNFKITLKKFWMINIMIFGIIISFFIVSIIISPVITNFLYPSVFTFAAPYIFYANLAALLGIANNMMDPVVLKYAPSYWQIVILGVYAVIYVSAGYILINDYGINGLIAASISASTIRLILLSIIGHRYVTIIEKSAIKCQDISNFKEVK